MTDTDSSTLISNLDKIHTTDLGVQRIKNNLSLDTEKVVEYCKEMIKDSASDIYRRGKNWYIEKDNCVITVNAYSYTIITAHKKKYYT